MTLGSIQFTVSNGLWTGGYHVLDANIESPSVSVSGDVVTVSGTGLEWCVLVLELSPEFSHESKFDLGLYPEFSPVIRPFYEDISLVMGFFDIDTDTGVSGLSVSDLITEETLTTDSNGLVAVTSGIDKHGDYDYMLGVSNNSVDVTYNYPYQRIKTELPVRLLNTDIYRLKQNTLSFEFLFDEDYSITEDMLFGDNSISLIVDNVVYPVNSFSDNGFDFIVPVGDTSICNMKLRIGGNMYLPKYDLEFVHGVSIVSCSTGSELKAELESADCAGVVLFTFQSH